MLCGRWPLSRAGATWRFGGGSVSPSRVPGSHQRPTSAGLDGIAHVEDPVALIVQRMGRREIGGAAAQMDELAVAEPELVHAARMRSGAVDEGDRFRIFRHRNVEQFEAGGLQSLLLGLVGDRHDIAGDLQRVRPHVALGQRGLHDDARLARIGYVDGGEVLGRAFVREPQDAPAVGSDLDRHAFAHAAEAIELMMRDQLEVARDRR